MAAILNLVNGYKTYIAAFGLFCLAGYQASQGDYTTAYQSLMLALTAAGLRNAIAKVTTPVAPAAK